MAETLEVHIQVGRRTHRVGTLHGHVRGTSESSTFIYGTDWLANPKAFPLQPGLPLAHGGYHVSAENGSLPGALRDSAPDRWGRKLILRAMRKGQVLAPSTEIGFLVSLDDSSRIGALRFRLKADGEFLAAPSAGSVPPIIDVARLLSASDAVQEDSETAEDLRLLLGYGSPLGGARPKSVVLDSDGAMAIAKFPAANDFRDIAVGEVLSAELASRAGISVSKTRLLRIDGRSVSLVRRFDRDAQGGRTHFISAMTMIGAREGEDGTYTDLALAIRRFCVDPLGDARELFRRAAFNILATNLDDHLRNHAFLFDHVCGKWRLSPAYDMNPVPAAERQRCLTTWISEAGDEARLDNLLDVCRDFGLERGDARGIVGDVARTTMRWRDIGRELGLSGTDIAPYRAAFEHRQLEAALSMFGSLPRAPVRDPERKTPDPTTEETNEDGTGCGP